MSKKKKRRMLKDKARWAARKQPQYQHTPIRKSAKFDLIEMAGTRCMLCEQDFGSDITWHHLKPKYAGGDSSLENASLLCMNCQQRIHRYQWGSDEYRRLTKIILANRDSWTGRHINFPFD